MNYLLPILYLTLITLILILIIIFLIKQIIKKKETEQTFSELQTKIRTNTATNVDYYSLGVIYLSKKLFDQAIIQFRYALKTWDQSDTEGLANLYNTIGFTYFETNQYDLSVYYYNEAVKCVPEYTVALNNLAYAYEKKQMPIMAAEIYKKVLNYDSNNEIAKDKLDKLSRWKNLRDDRI